MAYTAASIAPDERWAERYRMLCEEKRELLKREIRDEFSGAVCRADSQLYPSRRGPGSSSQMRMARLEDRMG